MKLLITDLDNTLYDWVTFFATSFSGMVAELSRLLSVSQDQLLDEFRAIHQKYGTSEPPFAVAELPSVIAATPNASSEERLAYLAPALDVFSRLRTQHLHPYDGVHESLAYLTRQGVSVVAHTEAIAVNAYVRLEKLNLLQFFTRIYASGGPYPEHPRPGRSWSPPADLIRLIPPENKKPDPRIVLQILAEERVEVGDACYLGDSLTKDIGMAQAAGVQGIWAKYGTRYDPQLWKTLVRVTHWTAKDVAREENLRHGSGTILPNYTIQSVSELIDLTQRIGVASREIV